MEPDSTSKTYQEAGVDIDAGSRAKALIKPLAASTNRPGVIGEIGHFGGMFQLPAGFKEPVLVSSTDSVGTKVKLAVQTGRLQGVGVDIVSHCVNDILVLGAEPLFFLDYIGIGQLVPEDVEQIVKGLAVACKSAGCALIGGETAELPSLYQPGDFDLAGFVVGVVEREAIIDGSRVQAGDTVLGLPSSGLHTNGYTLARRVLRTDDDPAALDAFSSELGRTLGEALLEPHRAYYPVLKPVLPFIRGMAHITGGGLLGNIPRVLPEGTAVEIDREAWERPPIFRLIQEAGPIEQHEMDRVFNQGIGMVLIVAEKDSMRVAGLLPEAISIGKVVSQNDETRVHLL